MSSADLLSVCRFCSEPCPANNLILKRGFREKTQNILCMLITVLSKQGQSQHICKSCQSTIEEFHEYKNRCRKVLTGWVPSPDEQQIEQGELQSLLDNCSEEVSLPEDLIETVVPKRKPPKPVRPKRSYIKRTPEEKARGVSYKHRFPVTCEICGKSMETIRFEGHMNRHKGLEPYVCVHCGETFSCKRNLSGHIRRMHAVGEETSCEICGKTMMSRRAYKAHLNAVHGERKHECQICNFKSRSRHSLKIHTDMHNQQRDYKCHYCGKGFYSNPVLKLHLRTHTGETPFKCPCPKGFVHRILYVKHMQKEHPDEPLMRIETSRAVKQSYREKAF